MRDRERMLTKLSGKGRQRSWRELREGAEYDQNIAYKILKR